ncbi:putative protein ABIL3 isoform X2 [Curcuma longa]|uniref:putative protein ABIL3 isoform X2 n=1 Tax=Curcuma longa TaxID=136217 RepID=UPI003D9E85E8
MEPPSPSGSSFSANHQQASSWDDLPVQQSLHFSDSLKGLRTMRSQLYSAAEYFELSYINNERKEVVMRALKEYAVEAIVNAVDHLGSVSYKVNNLLDEEVDEVFLAESEISCVEQKLRTCQMCIDQEGLSQQSLLIRTPKYHKHYILQGESLADSDTQPILKYEGFYPSKENNRIQGHQTAARHGLSLMRNARLRSPSPTPPERENMLLPPPSICSTPPLPRTEKIISQERRTSSPLRASSPLIRARTISDRSNNPKSSKQYILESQKSLPTSISAEQNHHKQPKRNLTKKRGFLKSLLSLNRSWTDESLYSYLDEY